LHYTVEFLGSLFDKDQVRTFVQCLKSLQDNVGYANDVRVAQDLLDQISEATNQEARAISRAGSIVLGWHERVLADRNLKVRRHVRRFRRLEPFW
jgi:CHAD domain-containing protein